MMFSGLSIYFFYWSFLICSMRTSFFNTLVHDHTSSTIKPATKPVRPSPHRPVHGMTAKHHINPRKSIGNYWLGQTLGHGSSGASAITWKPQYVYICLAITLAMAKYQEQTSRQCLDDISLSLLNPFIPNGWANILFLYFLHFFKYVHFPTVNRLCESRIP